MNDDETIITDNRSQQSDGSDDTITEASQETMQTKMIIEMQGMMKRMQEDYERMMKHIKFMEDTVISLAKENKEHEDYESAKETARKLKKKRKIEEGEASKSKINIDNQKIRRSVRINKKSQQKKENQREDKTICSKENENKRLDDQSIDEEDRKNDSQRKE